MCPSRWLLSFSVFALALLAPAQRAKGAAHGQNWASKERPAALRQLVLTDSHAPGQYRAETVRNLDAWYAAFHVHPGQALYLAPPDRVKIW